MELKYYIYSLFILLTLGYNSKAQKSSTDIANVKSIKGSKVERLAPIYFTYTEIAKYAIATLMNQPVKGVISKKQGNEFHVHYTRASDGSKYSYKVKFEGNRIIWANRDGRWRNTSSDEKITFREKRRTLVIVQTFSDGSEAIEEFNK